MFGTSHTPTPRCHNRQSHSSANPQPAGRALLVRARRDLALLTGTAGALGVLLLAQASPASAQGIAAYDGSALAGSRPPAQGITVNDRPPATVIVTLTLVPTGTKTPGTATLTPAPGSPTRTPSPTTGTPQPDPGSDGGTVPTLTPTPPTATGEPTTQPASTRTPVPQQTVGVSDAPVVWGTPPPETAASGDEVPTGGKPPASSSANRSPASGGTAPGGAAPGSTANGLGSSSSSSEMLGLDELGTSDAPSTSGDPTSVRNAPAPANRPTDRTPRATSGSPVAGQSGADSQTSSTNDASIPPPVAEPLNTEAIAPIEPGEQDSDPVECSPDADTDCASAPPDGNLQAPEISVDSPGVLITPMGSGNGRSQ